MAILAAAVVVGLIASHRSEAHEPRGTTVSLTLSGAPAGRAIPSGFLGLSLEYPAVEAYAGTDPNAINPVFEQLIRNLTPGQAPNLRIGGDTTDWTWWPVPGVAKPHGIRYTIGNNFAAVTAALAHAVGARLILGVNLELDSKIDAATEARALVAGVGANSIEALELGNEPELYGSFSFYKTAGGRHVNGRPAGYDFSSYLPDFARIAKSLPDVALAGPATGAPKWIPELGKFLRAEPRVTLATLHRYPLQLCFRPAASPAYPSVAHILAPSASAG
ncbi:MAG: hypothetical protein ACRDPA_13090, partial [Solirubrobacteraceae bacterium]